ncbi:hypothetical protein N0X72_10565 [Streptomyces carpaticus]|uniref:Uncharacterized protein n=2 Tax=Streptomyces TaxID=1883 RepID=A0A1I6VBD9_9ACTN|nr:MULTISPECIES: hypothetical protein [Streptomyces]MCK1815420.1 hypothetical protein [Streptomyces sp. XM4011]QKV69400.1 hypothetical protein HUT13_11830 [Streptomyces harbinensis]UWM49426.1 hypothetical protein N0X72_10565 [Streptomyces carpaticus]SFT10920.1 hypothetical protein SAMN05444716_107296 [Streptomyces harbinensis]
MPQLSAPRPAEPRQVAGPLERLLVGVGCLMVIGAPLIALASCAVGR